MCPLSFVINDGKQGDQLCCQVNGHHSSILRHHCSCDCLYEDLDSPEVLCIFLLPDTIQVLPHLSAALSGELISQVILVSAPGLHWQQKLWLNGEYSSSKRSTTLHLQVAKHKIHFKSRCWGSHAIVASSLFPLAHANLVPPSTVSGAPCDSKRPRLGKYNNARAVEFITVILHRSDAMQSISVAKSNCQIDSVNIIEQTCLVASLPFFLLFISTGRPLGKTQSITTTSRSE